MSIRTDQVNLIVNVNGDKARKELNDLRKNSADVTEEMKKLKRGTQEYIDKSNELKNINTRMTELKSSIGLTGLTLKELNNEMRKLQAMKGSLTPQTKEFDELQKKINAVGSRIYEVKNGVSGFGTTMSKIKDSLKGFGNVAIAMLGFDFLTTQFKNIIQGAGKMSDQLADLQRVAGLTSAQAKDLGKSLSAIDTRTSTSGLRDIAIIAGKLGVEGKDNIFEFTKAVDMLVVSLGDELGNASEITSQLGKILNVFDGEVNGENITKLGNAVVTLANAGVATGGFITDFTQRVAGIAKASNLSLGSTVGLAAGFEELGLRSESSATALQKLLSKIAEDVPAAAKIANMDLAKFNALFAEKPQEALLKYANGLVKNKTGFAEITKSFIDAGETGARVVQTLQAIGQRSEFLQTKIALGNSSMKESTAITEAYNLKNETLGATLDKISKRMASLFQNSAFNDGLKSIVAGFASLIGATEKTQSALEEFRKEQENVNHLEKDLLPLINRYDELSKKATELGGTTKLSAAEQVEMNKVISAVAAEIPLAVTEMDKYGRAIGISTTRAREFIQMHQLMLKEKNREAIQDQKNELEKLNQQAQLDLQGIGASIRTQKPIVDAILELSAKGYAITENQQKTVDNFNKLIENGNSKLKTFQDRTRGMKGLIAELQGDNLKNILNEIPAPSNAAPGIVAATDDAKTVDKKLKNVQSAKDKAAKEEADKYKKLLDELAKLREDAELAGQSDDEKERLRITQKYDKLEKEAKGYLDIILELSYLESGELIALQEKITEKQSEENKKKLIEYVDYLAKKAEEREAAAKEEEDAKAAETRAALEKNAKDREKRLQDEIDFNEDLKQAIFDGINITMGAISDIASMVATNQQNQLKRELKNNDIRKTAQERLLKNHLISQKQYDREVAKIEADSEKRKHDLAVKEAKRQKAFAIVNAIINTAEAVTKAWGQGGAILGPIMATLVGIAGGIQIAAIANTEVPVARKGLFLDNGPSHEEGGIGMYDNRTGRQMAEIEGGESVMVLSKQATANNRGIISALMNSSQGNGHSINYSWANKHAALTPHMVPMMAKGGVIPGTDNSQMTQEFSNLASILQAALINNNSSSTQPTTLRAVVSLRDIRNADATYEMLRRTSSINQNN